MRPRFLPHVLASAPLILGMIAAPLFRADAAPSDYAKKLTLTVNPSRVGANTASIADVPVPVRLSTSIDGFSYSDFLVANGGDLLFTDDAGNALAHEIEHWNTAGESIVWVKMPSFGPGQKIYAYYGGPANAQNAASVWGDYVGVWHMAEADGTVADATGHGLDATPAGDATSQSVATVGPVGNGRVNATDRSANRLDVPYDSQLDLGNSLSFSGWAMLYGTRDDGRMALVMHKEKLWEQGWGVAIWPNTSDQVWFWGNSNYGTNPGEHGEYLGATGVPDLLQQWVHVTVTYSGNDGRIYINGQRWATIRSGDLTANSWVSAVNDNDKALSFGYTSSGTWDDGWTRPFQGAFDEFRLSDGATDAARVAAEYAAQMPDALLYSVGSMAAGEATLLSGTTFVTNSVNGKNTLTVTGTVSSVLGDSAKVFLAVGMAEPKDGDPAALMVGVATNTVTAAGETVFTWDGAILGTKVAFAVMNVVEADGSVQTNASATTVITFNDPAEYFWKANETGYWSDSTKWTTSIDDGLPRLGYPSYGSRFQTRWGSRTAEIFVDAAYTGLKGTTALGWRNDVIAFRGTVEGAAIGYPEGSGFGDGQYDNTHITFDGVSLTCGSYHVKHDSSLTMLNGAYLSTRWEFTVEGDNASLFVGDGCELNQIGVDGDRFLFAGGNASIVISNGLVRAKILRINGTGDSDGTYVGKAPAGIAFQGDHPQLLVSQYAKIHADGGADIPVTFTIPESGFTVTPIKKSGSTNRGFAELKDGVTHGLAFSVDPQSPFFKAQAQPRLTQQLVDWTYNDADYPVNQDGIKFSASPKVTFAYMPEEGSTKSGVVATLATSCGTVVLFR